MTYSSAKFHLQFQNEEYIAKGNMLIMNKNTSTIFYPNTYSILESRLPSVLSTKCINYRNLPFYEEVKDTELAHLFEHILLENICISATKYFSNKEIVAKGITTWDFQRNDANLFIIKITANIRLNNIYNDAFLNSVHLMEEILI